MEAGSLSTKQVFNIKILQSTTENVPLPSHFTNLGPNVFIAEEGSHAKHDTTSNRHEIASKSNVQTLNNTTKSNTKNPNTFSVKLGDN